MGSKCVCMCSVMSDCDPMGCSPPGSSVHGISQAKILEQLTISFSRGPSQPRNQTHVSWLAGRFFTTVLSGKPRQAELETPCSQGNQVNIGLWCSGWCWMGTASWGLLSNLSDPPQQAGSHQQSIPRDLTPLYLQGWPRWVKSALLLVLSYLSQYSCPHTKQDRSQRWNRTPQVCGALT